VQVQHRTQPHLHKRSYATSASCTDLLVVQVTQLPERLFYDLLVFFGDPAGDLYVFQLVDLPPELDGRPCPFVEEVGQNLYDTVEEAYAQARAILWVKRYTRVPVSAVASTRQLIAFSRLRSLVSVMIRFRWSGVGIVDPLMVYTSVDVTLARVIAAARR